MSVYIIYKFLYMIFFNHIKKISHVFIVIKLIVSIFAKNYKAYERYR